MHNFSDQELDHLCKEAADNFEATPGLAMWDNIKQRLDVEMPVQKKGKKRFFWLFGLPGLLLMSLIIGIEVNKVPEQITPVIKVDGSVSGVTKKTIGAKLENKHKIDFTDSKESKIDPLQSGVDNIIVSVTDQVSLQKNDLLQLTVSDLPNKNFIEPAGQTEKKELTTTENFVDRLQKDPKVNSFEESAATDLMHKGKSRSDTVNIIKISATKPKIKSNKLNRFEISGVFGPDFSNVGFVSPEKTGINLGLMAGYRFTDRFSIQTGILHSRKHYTAVGEAYKGYPGVNMNNTYVKMDWVDANCLMWDIPINMRYDWLLRPKQRAFVSAGLSSYILSEEDLQYHFRYYGDPGFRAWSNPENTSYWMSVVNISVGYEQRISSSFSIQAEPFIKIPIREMGYGKIYLNSLGIFLSFKYSPAPFLFKNKKTKKSL